MQNDKTKTNIIENKSSLYIPPLSIILKRLGISLCSLDKPEISVSSLFVKYLLTQILQKCDIDTKFYSEKYPDISDIVSSGKFKSLDEHFVHQGYYEGRLPAPLAFDPMWYRNRYADMAQLAAAAGDAGLERHYIEHG